MAFGGILGLAQQLMSTPLYVNVVALTVLAFVASIGLIALSGVRLGRFRCPTCGGRFAVRSITPLELDCVHRHARSPDSRPLQKT
jgi:hypothetical protein